MDRSKTFSERALKNLAGQFRAVTLWAGTSPYCRLACAEPLVWLAGLALVSFSVEHRVLLSAELGGFLSLLLEFKLLPVLVGAYLAMRLDRREQAKSGKPLPPSGVPFSVEDSPGLQFHHPRRYLYQQGLHQRQRARLLSGPPTL